MMTNFISKKTHRHAKTAVLALSLFIGSFSQAQVSRLSSYYNTPYQDSYQRVATGYNHYLEIKNGKLYACGSNNEAELGVTTQTTFVTEPVLVQTNQDWVTVSAGDGFSLGIKANGTLWAWGKNDKGQLGIGSNAVTQTPTQVGSEQWFSVSVGANFVLAIKSDGTLWAWGDNSMGQLGNGTSNTTANPDPIQIGTADNWWKISAGHSHSLALKADGTLWAWGANALGQIGDGNTSATGEHTPIQIGSDKWKSISAGGFFSTGIKTDGTLWAWGDNYYGQIANGNTNTQIVPSQIGSDKWKSVSAGRNHIVALKSEGTVYSWADEMGTETSQAGVVTQKTELSGIVQISAGDSFSFALKSNGNLYSWGKNDLGQLGQENSTDNAIPTFNNSVSEEVITAASAHWFTTFTLYSNGTIKGWGGSNDVFQLGVDTNGADQKTPIDVPTAQNNNIAVIPAIDHTLVLKDDGTLWGWGKSQYVGTGTEGQVLQNATQVGSDNDWIVVATGSFGTAGIKSDGTLWTWGNNSSGSLGLGDFTHRISPVQVGTDNNWRTVAMGSFHSIAIKSDGTLWGWGENYSGQASGGNNEDDVPSPMQVGTDNDWIYVSAGGSTSLAIKANGTLWGWGSSFFGQLGFEVPIPSKTTTPTQVGTDHFLQARVGNWSTLGLKTDGTLLACSNFNTYFGDLGMGDNNDYPTLTAVPLQNDVVQISGGQVHKTALKSHREDICTVGRNGNGELGVGSEEISINTYQCGVAPFVTQQPINVDSVTVSVQDDLAPEITTENGTLQLNATVNPSEANQDVTWSVVSGNAFASVNSDGLVTAISNGTAKIRATSVENTTIFGEIDVVVNIIPNVQTVVVSVQNDLAPEITTENGTLQLNATVNPPGANQDVTWSVVSGNAFASVNSDGLVTAISNGTAKIRATSVENTTILGEIDIVVNIVPNVQSVVVSVQDDLAPEITTENGTLQLNATVNPSGANQDVTWSVVSGNAFASVNSDGLVTAISNGTAKIRATSVENTTIFGEIDVTINIVLSINEIQESAFSIYPNPTNGMVTIETSHEISDITIINTIGQYVLSSKSKKIDLSSFKSGIYIIKIQLDNNTVITKKIIRN